MNIHPKSSVDLGTYAAEITRKFVLMDHDVTVFTMNDDQGSLPTREIWRGIEIHRPLHIDISDSLPTSSQKTSANGAEDCTFR